MPNSRLRYSVQVYVSRVTLSNWARRFLIYEENAYCSTFRRYFAACDGDEFGAEFRPEHDDEPNGHFLDIVNNALQAQEKSQEHQRDDLDVFDYDVDLQQVKRKCCLRIAAH